MISEDDRGFTLGDGLFETVLAVDGDLRLWDEHLDRLIRGCAVLDLPPPDRDRCLAAATAALDAKGLAQDRAAVRLNWSAGAGGRGLDRPKSLTPVLTATAAPAPPVGGATRLHTASVRRNEHSPGARLKTLSYLDSVLARREAVKAGAEEALLLNGRGDLACAAAGNLFWSVSSGELRTPALECGVLDGVMRATLITRATRAGLLVREVRESRAGLDHALAVFVTNSLIGVRVVAWLDGAALEPHDLWRALPALVADVC